MGDNRAQQTGVLVAVFFVFCLFVVSIWVLDVDHPVQTGMQTSSLTVGKPVDHSLPTTNPETELEQILGEHFSTNIEDAIAHLAFLLDPENYDRIIRINFLLSRAVDQGDDLSHLGRYGVRKHSDGNYTIDLTNHRGWQTLDFILASLLDEESLRDSIVPALRLSGFETADINRLSEYLSVNNPAMENQERYLTILREEIERLGPNPDEVTDRALFLQVMLAIQERTDIATGQLMKTWALDLMSLFDTRKQQVLFNLFAANPQLMNIIPVPTEEAVDIFIQQLHAGTYQALIDTL